MNNREKQAREELAVFREFANVCSALPLVPETARPGADPPDILCNLRSDEPLAFELVQCEDVAKEDAIPGKYIAVMPRKLKVKLELENAIQIAYREALAAGRIDQPQQFEFHSVRVYFEDGFPSKNRRKTIAKRVITLLNQHGPGHHNIKDGIVRSIHCERVPENFQIEGPPRFYIPSGYGARPYIVERIEEKLANKYDSGYQTHLLAWSTTVCHAESVVWRDRLTNLLKSNGMHPFERIWVFGTHEQSIVFDSRASSAS